MSNTAGTTIKEQNNNKGILEKTRDYIHKKVATEDQLLHEKPYAEQIKQTIPTTTHEVAETLDATINDVKKKFNERLDEGTDRVPEHLQKQQQQKSSGILPAPVKNKLYEATKSPEVKEREEFREKPFTEKLQDLGTGKTQENFSELMA